MAAEVGRRRTGEKSVGVGMVSIVAIPLGRYQHSTHRLRVGAQGGRLWSVCQEAHCELALALVEAEDGGNAFYPAMDLIAAALALHAGAGGRRKLAPARVDEIRGKLRAAEKRGGDFWAVSDETNLRLYEAVAGGGPAAADALTRSDTDLSKRVQGQKYWSSVYDTAQFVLSRHAGRTGKAAERTTVRQVLDLLRRLA